MMSSKLNQTPAERPFGYTPAHVSRYARRQRPDPQMVARDGGQIKL